MGVAEMVTTKFDNLQLNMIKINIMLNMLSNDYYENRQNIMTFNEMVDIIKML